MIKTICICDRCGQESAIPMAINITEYDIETERITEWNLMPFTKHLCHPCALHLYNEITSHEFHSPARSKEQPLTAEKKQQKQESFPIPEKAEQKEEQRLPVPDEKAEPQKAEPEKKETPREKIDKGKVMALFNAGWKPKDIASEMKLDPVQVKNLLYYERKKKEKMANGL